MGRAGKAASAWAWRAVGVAAMLAVVGGLWWSEQRRVDAIVGTEQALREQFTHLGLPEAVARCRELWSRLQSDPRPVALAWQPGLLDVYLLAGVDERSMRHVACDGVEIRQGLRVPRPLLDRLPGREAAAAPLPNLLEVAAQPRAPGLQAIELALDPHPSAAVGVLQRGWRDGQPQPSHALAADLPRLFSVQPPGLPAAPLLQPLVAHDWLKDPQAAFSVLADHVPPDSRVVLLELGSQRMTVTVTGRFEQDGGRPPAGYGEADFDEHGVRSIGWWYPREQPTWGCAVGRPLAEVREAFLAQRSQARPDSYHARYGCGEGIEPGGAWQFMAPRRRR